MRASLRTLAAWLILLPAGCGGDPEGEGQPPVAEPSPAAVAPSLRRLTQDQYRNAITDLFGEGLILPTSLEPDTQLDGLLAVGASVTSISPLGTEQYEDAAYDVAEQVLLDEARRGPIVGCTPAAVVDDACAAQFVTSVGRRAWRRSLTAEESALLVGIAGAAAAELDDFHAGLQYALAGILQSPHFLYRQELGQVDPADATRRVYTAPELASRLAFLFWDSLPDDALLDAAEAGELDTAEGIEAQARRMLEDPRARRGVRSFVTDWLELWQLDDLSKDPTIFPHYTDALGPSAREETLLVVEDLVFERDAHFGELLTTRNTFVDPTLAMIYNIPAPARDGFGAVELPLESGRIGFLGQASFLALQSHAVSTSATLRGKFVRESLLCEEIPPPPADLNTSIPEPSPDAPTLRERVDAHLENAYCAGCHQMTDPIGLGLENFDGLGLWRTLENGAPIDPTGDLDGLAFSDARTLAAAIRQHPHFGPCTTDMLYSWATGHHPTAEEAATLDWLYGRFEAEGGSLSELMVTLATSEGFRTVGEIE